MPHEPAWVSYQEHARIVGGDVCFIPFYEDLSTIGTRLKQDKAVKLLILNNPNNPRGYVYSEQDLRSLVYECANAGVTVLVDESYSDFCIEKPYFSGKETLSQSMKTLSL